MFSGCTRADGPNHTSAGCAGPQWAQLTAGRRMARHVALSLACHSKFCERKKTEQIERKLETCAQARASRKTLANQSCVTDVEHAETCVLTAASQKTSSARIRKSGEAGQRETCARTTASRKTYLASTEHTQTCALTAASGRTLSDGRWGIE
jgi:hypothetical protein